MNPARRDDAAPYQSAVVDLLAQDRLRGWTDTSQPRAGLARAGGVLLLTIGSLLLAYLPGAVGSAVAMDRATVCAPGHVVGDEAECLVPVPGRLTGTWGYGTWRFDPDPAGLRDASLRFAGDDGDPDTWTPALREVLGGGPVTALYWRSDPVAFDVRGGRVETLAFGTTYLAVGAWFGVMCLSFGTGGLLRLGRRGPGRLWTAVLAASGTAALTCIGIDVFAPRSWAFEGALWLVAVLATGALAGRRRERHGR